MFRYRRILENNTWTNSRCNETNGDFLYHHQAFYARHFALSKDKQVRHIMRANLMLTMPRSLSQNMAVFQLDRQWHINWLYALALNGLYVMAI
ncbi:uncharacterized protein PHALS_14923 [Plasmopara halstedii]|uniref:Uncharacterized protein n=1 Tax=Plasmopara halstedii TaxID=4781 RepID=A0A0P1A7N0_PLAHL|nr:uncharacterized protein PHALS_14923 [Plasmopara halstedii]CEG36662.1 hypothetical protein PHALS_14923 [Plasmopara halstedii]|eukprot:XP_024573031.1 hypothetical protein PHALS_14923 [Plasmopara halstedii]